MNDKTNEPHSIDHPSRRGFLHHSASVAFAGGLLPSLVACRSALADDAVATGEASTKGDSPRIVNIINFVRQNEPRIDWITEDVLYDTVVEQIASMKRHNLRGTFLLQYDALVDPRYQELFKQQPVGMFEIGAWWEIPQPLVEDAGYEWRGRYPWDWHADVGFSTGYSPEERVRLVDTYVAKFKEVFGYTPKSVGSWFIDAVTLAHFADSYGIVASCNCKDQIGTDGYTLWGGYWNQAYYPSRKNAYMPAQNAENQIPVPIFRMLGSDPIHQYDSGLGTDRQRVISLEPVYTPAGGDEAWCKWYFDALVDGPAMAFGYVQAGQENSFTWKRMQKGFEIQMPMIAALRDQQKLSVQTLAESGEWFRGQYKETPATSVTVLDDYSEKDLKTVWFNSRFYRANLLWEAGTLRFRDIHLFDESVASDYLDRAGKSTQCFYHTLPVVDGWNWSSTTQIAGLRFKTAAGADIKGAGPTVSANTPGKLTVTWPTVSPQGAITIAFDERSLSITTSGELKNNWSLVLDTKKEAELPFAKINEDRLVCNYRDHAYAVNLTQGKFSGGNNATLQLVPVDNRLVFDLSRSKS